MLFYFTTIATISMFCLGLRAITDTGMIGWPIRQFFLKYAPRLGKPIILCSTCMSSFWGTLIYWFSIFSTGLTIDIGIIAMWIGVTISASFVNALFWEYYQNINTCQNKRD